MTDEATITVIATGLENAAAKQPNKIMPTLQYQNTPNVTRPTGAATMNRPTMGNMGTSGFGTGSFGTATQTQQAPQQTPTFNGIQKPRQPESTVQQVDIKIPDFLKNSRR